MTKIAIVYHTIHGHTEVIAREIAKGAATNLIPGRRSQTRVIPGCHISGFQPSE